MEKRIGTAIVVIEDTSGIEQLNQIVTEHATLVLGRQGIPMRERGLSIISLVLEGSTDEIGALTGKIGRIPGIRIKSVLAT